MTTAVLADDERLMREQLRARLAEVWPDLEIVAEAKNGQEAIDAVHAHRPDLVFLDIRMPEKDGLQAAREIPAIALTLTIVERWICQNSAGSSSSTSSLIGLRISAS